MVDVTAPDPCGCCGGTVGEGCGYPQWLCCEACTHFGDAIQAPLLEELAELRATHSAALADPRPGIPCEPDPADITATEDRARGAVVNCRGWGCNRDECTTCAAIRDYYERLDGESETVPSLRREIARVTTELDRCRKRLADLADELVRQRPVIDAALAFHGCGTKNVNARIDDVLTAGLTYMQGEPDA